MRAFLAVLATTILLTTAPANTQDEQVGAESQAQSCSLRDVTGSWMFATGVGQLFAPAPPFSGQAITAIGTMNIDAQGNLSGKFDNTIAGFGSFTNNTYNGTIEVNSDCTATVVFTTSEGRSRTDSMVIVEDGSEMLGMTRDKTLPWTATFKRIRSRRLQRADQ